METELKPDKETISLDYTAKGFANWTIKVKDESLTEATILRLVELDKSMREKFPINVMNQA